MFKVYISADLEGVNGVVYPSQTEPINEGYKYAQKQQHKELNCIIEALIDAGAGHITLNDAHGSMDNLTLSELNSKVELITGKPKPVSMVTGLDETYNCVIFAGYHSKAGSEKGVLAHTFSTIYKNVKLNDVSVGEIELNAVYAGIKKVPVALLTGDYTACEQAKDSLKTVSTVCVKKAISTTAAICRPEEELFEDLREKTLALVKNSREFGLYIKNPPYKLELDFVDRKMADIAELLPCIERISDSSVLYNSENYEDVYKLLQFLTATLSK
ncbi:MAG: M55 family metallopeptidase [bacterium]